MNENTASKLDDLTRKVQKLISLHREALNSLEKVTAENRDLKQKLEESRNQIANMNQRNSLLALGNSIAKTEEERRHLRNTINGLIREVDQCISRLNA